MLDGSGYTQTKEDQSNGPINIDNRDHIFNISVLDCCESSKNPHNANPAGRQLDYFLG